MIINLKQYEPFTLEFIRFIPSLVQQQHLKMIDWNQVQKYAMSSQNFMAIFVNKWRKGYVDRQVSKVQVKFPTFSGINWSAPKHSKGKTITECDGEVKVDIYEWQGTSPLQKMCVMVTKQGDFAGIIDQGTSALYVANISGHPIVVTDDIQFRNSDGSTNLDIPKALLKQNGAPVAQFIIKTGKQFIDQQIH